MISATLGTTSTDALRWDSKENRFKWDEAGGRLVGVERITTAS